MAFLLGKNGPRGATVSETFLLALEIMLKTAKSAPTSFLRAAKRPPRGPQEAPKRAPRGPKRPPRGPQDAPRGPKRPPKRPQEAPKSRFCARLVSTDAPTRRPLFVSFVALGKSAFFFRSVRASSATKRFSFETSSTFVARDLLLENVRPGM